MATVNTTDALTLGAGLARRLSVALERLQRKNIALMTLTATIARSTPTVGGDARYTESWATVASDVPCRLTAPKPSDLESVYSSAHTIDWTGHFALDADLDKGDVLTISGQKYTLVGIVGNIQHRGEQRVLLESLYSRRDDLP